jgi:glyoxalase family protein
MSTTEGAVVDVIAKRGDRGRQAGGTVHHIAFRAPDGETQKRWREQLVEAGVSVTEIVDRPYFTPIYFHEPGGVLPHSRRVA